MRKRTFSIQAAILGVGCWCGWSAQTVDPAGLELARDKKALLAVVVGAEAPAAAKASAADLALYLGRMSGAEFRVETGDGSAGIVVGRPADFAKLPFAPQFGAGPFEREDYVLRSTDRGLFLLGASDLAVSHAVGTCSTAWATGSFSPGRCGK